MKTKKIHMKFVNGPDSPNSYRGMKFVGKNWERISLYKNIGVGEETL